MMVQSQSRRSLSKALVREGAPLKHATGGLDRIIGNGLDNHPPRVGQGHKDLAARPESDPFPKLGRNDDLPFGRGFNDSHF